LQPKIRFKGYKDNWKRKELKDVATITGGGTPSTSVSDYWNGDIPWFTPTEISGKKYVSTSARKITKEGLENSSAKLLPVGTILLTTRATLGEMAIATVPVTTNQGFQSIIPNEEVYGEFIYYLQPQIRKYCYIKASGSTFLEISKSNLERFKFYLPSFEEQQKIASFFSLLDQKIEKQQEKIEQLELFKKGMLQKIFSQEIRFKDENGQDFPEWGTVKLGDLGETYGGLSGKTKDDFGDGECSFITYMNVFTNTVAKIDGLEKVSIGAYEKQNKVKTGDILFTASSETPEEVGMASVWNYEIPNVYLNSFCFGFRLTKPVDPIFLAYLLRSGVYRKQITMLAQGSTRYNLSKSSLMNMEVSLPENEEQKLIRDFFIRLDSKLAMEIEKLDHLETMKRGLMQKMFV